MPYEEGKGYKGRKTIATLIDINCQVTKKQVDRKVKVFLLLLSHKGQAQQSQSGRGGRATTKSIDLGGQ